MDENNEHARVNALCIITGMGVMFSDEYDGTTNWIGLIQYSRILSGIRRQWGIPTGELTLFIAKISIGKPCDTAEYKNSVKEFTAFVAGTSFELTNKKI